MDCFIKIIKFWQVMAMVELMAMDELQMEKVMLVFIVVVIIVLWVSLLVIIYFLLQAVIMVLVIYVMLQQGLVDEHQCLLFIVCFQLVLHAEVSIIYFMHLLKFLAFTKLLEYLLEFNYELQSLLKQLSILEVLVL